jgi:integrase/recombinase XerD
MLVRDAIRAFLSHRRASCVAGTLLSYEQRLDDWQLWRKATGYGPTLAEVSLAELRVYFAQLAARCKPRTVHNHHRVLKSLWRWLAAETDTEGRPLLTEEQRNYFTNGRIALPRVVERERPAVKLAQVETLLSGCGDDEEGLRNRAIVLLLWESGVRVHELASLNQADLDMAERQARVIGKGQKEGYLWWGSRTASALLRYMRVRRGSLSGPLFRGVSSRNNGGAMTGNAVRLMLKRLAKSVGVKLPEGATVHGFRHGCAREMRRLGCTKEEVRDILRHEDLKTTERYLGLDVEAPRSAHRRAYGGGGGEAERRSRKG